MCPSVSVTLSWKLWLCITKGSRILFCDKTMWGFLSACLCKSSLFTELRRLFSVVFFSFGVEMYLIRQHIRHDTSLTNLFFGFSLQHGEATTHFQINNPLYPPWLKDIQNFIFHHLIPLNQYMCLTVQSHKMFGIRLTLNSFWMYTFQFIYVFI